MRTLGDDLDMGIIETEIERLGAEIDGHDVESR
jgi:hypothetical protein